MPRFHVRYTYRAEATTTLHADSYESACEEVRELIEADETGIDAEEIHDIDFHVAEMHPVTRDGREMWTTYVRDGDTRGHQSALASAPLFAQAGA